MKKLLLPLFLILGGCASGHNFTEKQRCYAREFAMPCPCGLMPMVTDNPNTDYSIDICCETDEDDY